VVSATSQPAQAPARGKRADALRNQQELIRAATAAVHRAAKIARLR